MWLLFTLSIHKLTLVIHESGRKWNGKNGTVLLMSYALIMGSFKFIDNMVFNKKMN